MIEVLTPVGRMVSGHPLEAFAVIDDRTNQPKLDSLGAPRTSTTIGIAIPKGAEREWKDTEWGSKIYAEGMQAWPAGEWRAPTFAWKVIDGDSQIPNKKGHKPCDKEGWPGHWIVMASTELSVKCYHAGRYEPHQVIQRKEEIKKGDYIRLLLSVKGNNPSQSPGVYINPSLFELSRAGVEIISANAPDAGAAFGGVAPQLPAGAQLAPATGTPPPPVEPHHAFVTGAGAPPPPPPPARQMTALANGATYEAMTKAGWTDALLVQHGYMVG